MAYIKLTTGQGIGVTKEQGREVWSVMQGDKEPSPEQEKFMRQVVDIRLSFNNAPDSYISQHLEEYREWCMRDWRVGYDGKPSKPQYPYQWSIAKKYGFV